MYSRKMVTISLPFITLFLSLVLTITSVTAISPEAVTNAESEVVTYTDPLLDFAVEYPADWIVAPRDDSYGVGATLSFNAPYSLTTEKEVVDLHDSPIKIVIGMYMVEWSGKETLEEWTNEYNELSKVFEDNERKITESHIVQVDGLAALQIAGASPITEYKYVNIPRGEIVWFIWSNIDNTQSAIFDQFVKSFRFGKNTPLKLQEAYGDEFQPLPISRDQNQSQMALNGWRVPLNGGPWTATCNSTAHNNNRSKYAIDVARSTGTSVYASNSSSIVFLGWQPGGFGNYVKLTTSSYKHYYAHLFAFDENLMTPPYTVSKGGRVGWVGSTGNSSGSHLHFEVRNSSNVGVSLVGMSGFTAGNYPYPHNPCGTVQY